MTLTNRLLRIALLLSLLLAVEGIAAGKEKKETKKYAENLLEQVESVLGEERVWSAFDRLVSQDSDMPEGLEVVRADLVLVKPEDIWDKVKDTVKKVARRGWSGPFSREESDVIGLWDIQWFHVRPVSSEDLPNLRVELQSALSELEKSRGQDVPLYTTQQSDQVRDTLKKNIEKKIESCLEQRTTLPFFFIFNTRKKGVQRVLKYTFSPEDFSPWGDEGAASKDIQKKFQFKDYYRVSSDVWRTSEESKNNLKHLKELLKEPKGWPKGPSRPYPSLWMQWNAETGEFTLFRKKKKEEKEEKNNYAQRRNQRTD